MSKSSLSKIVRTYIEQAKDGSSNHYNTAKCPPPSNSTSKKIAPPQKQKTGQVIATPDPKPQSKPLKLAVVEPVPQVMSSKNVSLNSSQLQRSPSKTRVGQLVAPNKGGYEDKDREKDKGPVLSREKLKSMVGELHSDGEKLPQIMSKVSNVPGEKSGKTQVRFGGNSKEIPGPIKSDWSSEGERLTERRHTEEAALKTDSEEDLEQAPTTTGKQSLLSRDAQKDDKYPGKTNRSPITTSAAIKTLTSAGPRISVSVLARDSHKGRKDRLFGNSGTVATDKFSNIRKLTTSQTALNHGTGLSSNGSFTFKTSITKNSSTATKVSHSTAHSSHDPPRKYLLPSEIQNLDDIMASASLDDFRMENLLGKGAYASTYLGIHTPTGLGVAMKVYVFNEKNHLKEAIESEVRILKKLNHPNIVKLYQCFEKEKKTVLVLE